MLVTVVLVGLIGMHMTGCSGETRLVLLVPSSSSARKQFDCYYYHCDCAQHVISWAYWDNEPTDSFLMVKILYTGS